MSEERPLETCTICLNQRHLIRFKCSTKETTHGACAACYLSWSAKKNTCHACRRTILLADDDEFRPLARALNEINYARGKNKESMKGMLLGDMQDEIKEYKERMKILKENLDDFADEIKLLEVKNSSLETALVENDKRIQCLEKELEESKKPLKRAKVEAPPRLQSKQATRKSQRMPRAKTH